MRIGERLLGDHGVRPDQLQLALAAQPASGARLVSLLIANGSLPFDVGARALGAQRGVPCVLGKHLAARDPALAQLVPKELALTWGALPIGRATGGTLVVAVRDPDPQLQAAVERHVGGPVLVVVCPATRLDELIAEAYGTPPADEFDVSIDSAVDAPALPPNDHRGDADGLDIDSVHLSLTDLDDLRVTKDPSASGIINFSKLAGSPLPPRPPTLQETREAIEQEPTRDGVTEHVLKYMAGKWLAGMVMAVRDEQAIGYRGHGAQLGDVESIALPTTSPSTLQRAVASKKTSIQSVHGPVQDALARRLGTQTPSASPVMVDGEVVAVLVVGDPIHGFGDTDRSVSDLGRLAQILGSAYERLVGTR